jgi:uncharacterized membrane protein YfcA
MKMRALVSAQGHGRSRGNVDRWLGLAIGISGGVVASITGVGIDMILYAALVLLYRTDLKIAIPTSVLIMAFTSLVGISSNALLARIDPALYGIDREVFYNWLAAAPVVALGAPFGAWIVNRISRTPTLIFVSILCIGQLLWTLVEESVGGWALVGTIIGLLAMNLLFHILWRAGDEKAA